jgi:hypothetical protein
VTLPCNRLPAPDIQVLMRDRPRIVTLLLGAALALAATPLWLDEAFA